MSNDFAIMFAFFLFFALVLVGIILYSKKREPSDIPIAKESDGTDYASRVNDLEYGDISDNFATAIHLDVPDEVYSDTVIKDEDKGEFSETGVFSVSEAELRVIKSSGRGTQNASTKV